MTWAAYAFLSEDEEASEQNGNEKAEGWWALIERSLPFVAPEDGTAYAIVASVSDSKFDKASEIDDKQSFPEGRIFGATGEIRWRPWCNGRHLMLLTDADSSVGTLKEMGFDDAIPIDGVNEDLASHLLWGELESDDKWRDGRIPKDLEYPVKAVKEGQLVWLKVKSYVDETGVVQFTRFVEVT